MKITVGGVTPKTAAKVGLDIAKGVGVVAAVVGGLMLLVYVSMKEH